jgi:hypothetical protein
LATGLSILVWVGQHLGAGHAILSEPHSFLISAWFPLSSHHIQRLWILETQVLLCFLSLPS